MTRIFNVLLTSRCKLFERSDPKVTDCHLTHLATSTPSLMHPFQIQFSSSHNHHPAAARSRLIKSHLRSQSLRFPFSPLQLSLPFALDQSVVSVLYQAHLWESFSPWVSPPLTKTHFLEPPLGAQCRQYRTTAGGREHIFSSMLSAKGGEVGEEYVLLAVLLSSCVLFVYCVCI